METKRTRRKSWILVIAMALSIACVVGGTLAWLLADTIEVKNTFTDSNIDITLDETGEDLDDTADVKEVEYEMVPGFTIDKNPSVTVIGGSEDCWLFIKITESTEPDLDNYIAYAIESGWTFAAGTTEDSDTIIIGRKVTQNVNSQTYTILAAGNWTDDDQVTYSWNKDQVLVKSTVTAEMMDAITETKPTLTFEAYAVQLYKTNNQEFGIEEAWLKAQDLN